MRGQNQNLLYTKKKKVLLSEKEKEQVTDPSSETTEKIRKQKEKAFYKSQEKFAFVLEKYLLNLSRQNVTKLSYKELMNACLEYFKINKTTYQEVFLNKLNKKLGVVAPQIAEQQTYKLDTLFSICRSLQGESHGKLKAIQEWEKIISIKRKQRRNY